MARTEGGVVAIDAVDDLGLATGLGFAHAHDGLREGRRGPRVAPHAGRPGPDPGLLRGCERLSPRPPPALRAGPRLLPAGALGGAGHAAHRPGHVVRGTRPNPAGHGEVPDPGPPGRRRRGKAEAALPASS